VIGYVDRKTIVEKMVVKTQPTLARCRQRRRNSGEAPAFRRIEKSDINEMGREREEMTR